jgi:hypothetical protein
MEKDLIRLEYEPPQEIEVDAHFYHILACIGVKLLRALFPRCEPETARCSVKLHASAYFRGPSLSTLTSLKCRFLASAAVIGLTLVQSCELSSATGTLSR